MTGGPYLSHAIHRHRVAPTPEQGKRVAPTGNDVKRIMHHVVRRAGRGGGLAALAIAGAVMLQAQAPSSSLTPTERALIQHVDAHNDEALSLLERLVNVNSGTQNLAGVKQVGDILRGELDALGFTTEWIDGSAWQRAGHLVARHSGTSPKLLLIGHLDTVFEADSPFQKFERLDANFARGPGICDMKGGDVIMLQALKALKSAGLLDAMNVTVVLTGDEEAPGRPLARAREALVAAAKGAAAAIGFENGDGDPAHAVVARRGTTSWQLTVTSTTGHSSQIFSKDLGSGAVFEAARILNALREQLAGQPHLTFNPGVIVGGTTVEFDAPTARGTAFGKTNVVAARALVSGDLRALSPGQFEAAMKTMRAIAATPLPNTKSEIVFDEGYPPLSPAPGNERLLALYTRASQDAGLGAVTAVSPDRAGAADVSFVAGHVPMIIDAIGMKGRDDHSPQETGDLRTLPVQTKRAALLLARLAQGSR
jgi:glutamate carboxypeptidase